jgi:hypothetical protein
MNIKRIAAGVVAAAALTVVPVTAANASVHHFCPVVSIYSSVNGTLTTPSPLHVGEVLKRVDTRGTYTVTSVKPGGPLDTVKVSPKLPKNTIFDFRACR